MTDQILAAGDRARLARKRARRIWPASPEEHRSKKMDPAMFLVFGGIEPHQRPPGRRDGRVRGKRSTVKPDLYTLRRVQRA